MVLQHLKVLGCTNVHTANKVEEEGILLVCVSTIIYSHFICRRYGYIFVCQHSWFCGAWGLYGLRQYSGQYDAKLDSLHCDFPNQFAFPSWFYHRCKSSVTRFRSPTKN